MKLLINFSVSAALFAFFFGTSYADLPVDPVEYAEWQNKMLQAIAENQTKGDNQALEKLARYVFQLSLPTNLEQGGRPVFQAAKEAILSRPNHGSYFLDALERSIQAEFAEARDAATAVRVHPVRGEIYLTLAQLPSPQVVGLLGELLYDERDPWKDEPSIDRRPRPNSLLATQTLNRIGLEGVQIIELKTTRDDEAALHQWKLWYEQVKAGTRTFRFKGEPQEYSLAGPVSEPREQKGGHRVAEAKDDQVFPTEAEDKKASSLAGWLPAIAGVLLAMAAWAVARRKSVAS